MKKLVLLALFSMGAIAHPIEKLYPLATDLNDNYEQVENCSIAIETNAPLEVTCDYLADRGAQVLEILVESLEAENIPVLKENRRALKDIAWDNLSLWEIGYGAWVLTDTTLEDSSKYLGRKRPDLIKPYLKPGTFEKLDKGGFLE